MWSCSLHEALSPHQPDFTRLIGAKPNRWQAHAARHYHRVRIDGDSAWTLERVANLYSSVVVAGVHKASTIKVAEAAKVIENSQRDINIAFMNELTIIFDRLGIDTAEVLAAAGTKWNFLPFR